MLLMKLNFDSQSKPQSSVYSRPGVETPVLSKASKMRLKGSTRIVEYVFCHVTHDEMAIDRTRAYENRFIA